MPPLEETPPSTNRLEFENARLGAGNLYFDILKSNIENLSFDETVSTLQNLMTFLEGKTKYKLDGIIGDLYRSNELDPEVLISVFDELGIEPKKVTPRVISLPGKKEKKGGGARPRRTGAGRTRSDNPVLESGRSLQGEGDVEGAIYYYQQAINEGCRDVEVIKELAALFMILVDMDHAVKYYDIALNVEPDDVDLISDKAAALIIDGQYNEAMKCHETIIKLDPGSVRGWKEKGVLLVKLGKFNRAIPCFEKILEKNPEDVESLGNLALCYKEINNPKKEIDYLNRFLKLNPDDKDAWIERAEIFIHYKRFKSALKCYNSVLKQDPRDFVTLRKKAGVLRKMGLDAEADTCLAKANRLMPVRHPSIEIPKAGSRYSAITDGLHRLTKSLRHNEE